MLQIEKTILKESSILGKSKLIPKYIHQTYKSWAQVPNEMKLSISKMREINSNYQYFFYDDNEILQFLHRFYPSKIDLYLRIDPSYGACRADYFRYLVMYQIGGIYLDIKSSYFGSFDDKLFPDDELLLSHWDISDGNQIGNHSKYGIANEFQNWHLICVPKHPILKNVIDKVEKNLMNYSPIKHGVGQKSVLRISGPIAYSQSILHSNMKDNYRLINYKEFGLIYDASENHNKLLPLHYSLLTIPIIKKNNFHKFSISFAFKFLQLLRKMLKKLIVNI